MMSKQQTQQDAKVSKVSEGGVRRSIAIRLIRHAESRNNQIYYDARQIFKGGTPEFDEDGWLAYVNRLRSADPGLSDLGKLQADRLANDFLTRHLLNQASHPATFIVSPMKRTIETIIPTLLQLEQQQNHGCHILIHGFYFESEGCHLCGKPEQGMNRTEISNLLSSEGVTSIPSFFGFDEDDPTKGWYTYGTGREEREESEARSAKFYLWLCEYLDAQLGDRTNSSTTDHQQRNSNDDIFDAGVTHPEDKHLNDHDRFSSRERKRRTAVLVGHGDFMSLLLKRIMGGFGHAVEAKGISHRSAFVHTNTGFTELEYFGNGRYLFLGTNHTPHLDDDITLKTGGSLKDGWSFMVPEDVHFLDNEVRVAFADELDDHVVEQTEALKDLYLKRRQSSSSSPDEQQQQIIGVVEGKGKSAIKSMILSRRGSGVVDSTRRLNKSMLTFEQFEGGSETATLTKDEITFVVKQGLKVIGCASLHVDKMTLTDIVVRESCRRSGVGTALIEAVKSNLKQAVDDQDFCLFVTPISDESKAFFHKLGFEAAAGDVEECLPRMKCRL